RSLAPNHAWVQAGERHDVASDAEQVVDLSAVDDRRPLRTGGLERRDVGGNGDELLDVAHGQDDLAGGEVLRGAEPEIDLAHLLVPRSVHNHGERPRLDIWKDEPAILQGLGRGL